METVPVRAEPVALAAFISPEMKAALVIRAKKADRSLSADVRRALRAATRRRTQRSSLAVSTSALG